MPWEEALMDNIFFHKEIFLKVFEPEKKINSPTFCLLQDTSYL